MLTLMFVVSVLFAIQNGIQYAVCYHLITLWNKLKLLIKYSINVLNMYKTALVSTLIQFYLYKLKRNWRDVYFGYYSNLKID